MSKPSKKIVVYKALCLGAHTNSYAVLIPENSQLLKDIVEENDLKSSRRCLGQESQALKDRKKFEKRTKPDKKNCRACKYWNDPGHLANYSYCSRLVLTDLDILTPVDEASYDRSHEFLYVPENFSCKYFMQIAPTKMIVPLEQIKDHIEG